MYLKIMVGNGMYAYIKCNVLKCDVENVVYLKNEKIVGDGKWVAYDVPTGLRITNTKTKKALIEKVNGLKEKIEDIRSTSYYQKQIKIKEDFEANYIDDNEEIKKEGVK